MSTDGTGGVYRRCGCADPGTGKRLGGRCLRLADPEHGRWCFAFQAHEGQPSSTRIRRGGYRTTRKAAAARDQLPGCTSLFDATAPPLTGTQLRLFRRWMEAHWKSASRVKPSRSPPSSSNDSAFFGIGVSAMACQWWAGRPCAGWPG